jgi:nucleoside-diphosphate-sugar epimerase
MIALVTGAAGFIGSTLVDRLLADGHIVYGLDCFTHDYSPTLKRQNLESALAHPNFHLIENTIAYANWAEILPKVTHIFHLAGQTGVRSSWGRDFAAHVNNNIVASQHLLEACAQYNPQARIVVASTSSAYGDSPVRPATEDSLPRPISPYGVSKMAVEYLCHAYHVAYQLPISIVRYFTVYGPRQRPDMAFSLFFRAALQGRPVIQYGDGMQTRDFTYVEDAVNGTLCVAAAGKPDTVYNIGGGHTVTLRQVFEMIERILGKPLTYDVQSTQRGDALYTMADTSRVRLRGYVPLTALEDGLQAQYTWIRESMQRNGELT